MATRPTLAKYDVTSPLSSVAIRYSMHKNGARVFPDSFSTSFFNCGMYNIKQISGHACGYMNLWNMKQNDGKFRETFSAEQ